MNRYKVRLAISYGTDRRQLETGRSVNLSTGGVYVESDRLLKVGTPLFVEFMLPGTTAVISCKAKVAWVNDPGTLSSRRLPPGMGLQFFSLSLGQMNDLKSFLGVGVFPVD